MNNNIDVNQLMTILSKMDKKDLEKGMAIANQILNSKNGNNLNGNR